MRTFKQFFEDELGTLEKQQKISPSNLEQQYITISGRKLVDQDGNVDDYLVPTRFKILSHGASQSEAGPKYLRIQNASDGEGPSEQRSKFVGKIYVVKADGIDSFLAPPPGVPDGGGMPGGDMGGGAMGNSSGMPPMK